MRVLLLFIIASLWSCSKECATIRIKGSDTEVNLSVQLAESFHSYFPGLMVTVSGGGSGLGITALLNETADIANSSRSIKASELVLFASKGIRIDSFIFAQDAIAFVVSDQLAVDSLTIAQLSNILSGTTKNWSALTAETLPINIYGRQSNSGTHEFIQKKMGIEFSPFAKEMNGNAQILEAIRSDRSGIGYVGAGYVTQGATRGIKVLTIKEDAESKAISPLDAEQIRLGQYYFQRPLYQYYKANNWAKVKPLLDFESNVTGLSIIRSSGYYPVKH